MHAHLIDHTVKTWIETNAVKNTFAASLALQLQRKGLLSDGQIGAVKRSIENDKAKAGMLTNTNAVNLENFSALAKAFDVAKAKGLKKPQMRFSKFQASLAPATGKNPGAIYIKAGDLYLGKVIGETLHSTSNCTPDHIDAIKETMKDPFEAAVKFARETGNCSICNRTLTNPESIKAGIGPICAEGFGF